MLNEKEKAEIFKALNHPLRIRILLTIAKKGYASYKELSKLEPKSGVLYHHLRLLGDLIYQDENKLYRLTEKGAWVVEFIEREFFEYNDVGIGKILLPRQFLDKISGKKYLLLTILAILLAPIWSNFRFSIFFIFISTESVISGPIDYLISLFGVAIVSYILQNILYGKSNFHNINLIDHFNRISVVFIIASALVMISCLIPNYYVLAVIYFLSQLIVLFYLMAEVSVTFRLPLKKAVIIVILLHYSGLMIHYLLQNFY